MKEKKQDENMAVTREQALKNFEGLMKITDISSLHQADQIDIIGNLFDFSYDFNSLAGIEHGFVLADQVMEDVLTPENLTVFYYDIANGWGYLRKLKYKDASSAWEFQQKELTKEIFHLRKAVDSTGFNSVDPLRQCQIYTNLGNCFSFIGRFVEAQECWNKAIDISPSFVMAIGNKANGLFHYGRVLFDNVHSNLFSVFSFHYLADALKRSHYLHPEAREGFENLHIWLRKLITANFPDEYLKKHPDLNNFDLGPDAQLKEYRLWCLKNKLYINPLNDLGAYSDASHDCLNMPTLVVPAKRAPVCINLYNQVKQEYATARYCYYISIEAYNLHFSDKDVPLVDTLEPIKYSYYVEQMKIAFRLAYSILDKIAFLLNDYLELDIKPNRVSFRTIWYENEQKKQLHSFFGNSDNWALRGLYWLSMDLYEKEGDFDLVLEPDAKEVASIRNHIEHKGFKVVSDVSFLPDSYKVEDISYSISRTEFERKTLRLLKLTRAALIYVAIAVSHEEQKREYNQQKAATFPIALVPEFMRT